MSKARHRYDGASRLVSSIMKRPDDSFLPDYCRKRILILGCGNRLFGDDGFGPAVIDHLIASYRIPDDVYVMDVGTGVRKLLFTLCVSTVMPSTIIIIDAVDKARPAGEVFEIPLGEIPLEKSDDFSLHQAPSSNLAKELEKKGVTVRILACQVCHIPDRVQPGLSEPVASAVQRLCNYIVTEVCSMHPGRAVESGQRTWIEFSTDPHRA